MGPMDVDILPDKAKEGFFRIVPHGPIDSDTYDGFREKADKVMANAKGVVVDLRDVDYISSAGLGVLFTMKKTLVQKNGELLFCNLKPQIKRLFDVVKALPKETIFESLEEADRYFYRIQNEEIERQKKKQP